MISSLPYDVLRCEELCFRLQKMQQTTDEEGRSYGELKVLCYRKWYFSPLFDLVTKYSHSLEMIFLNASEQHMHGR